MASILRGRPARFAGYLLLTACLAGGPGWAQDTAAPGAAEVPAITVESVGPDSFQTAWKKFPEAGRYEVSLGTDLGAANRGTQFVSAAAFAGANLMAATTYYFKVRAIAGGRAGAWSAVTAITTSLPVLTGLAVDDASDTAMHLTWPGLYAEIPDVTYEISLATDPAGTSPGLQTSAQNALLVNRLRPGTTYYVKLRLRRGQQAGPWSEAVPVATLAATAGSLVLPDSEGAPLNLAEVAHTTAKVNWSETPGASGYELAYLPVPSPETKSFLILKTPHPPAELDGLIPGKAYRIKWRALFANRVGAWSPDLAFSTFPDPPAPETLYVARVTDAYVTLTWTAQEGVAYEALASVDEPGEEGSHQIVRRGEARLGGLQENTRYWAKVRTLNQGGPGTWSSPLAFITVLDSAPQGLAVLRQSPSESAATWGRVPGNAPVAYELRWAAAGEPWRLLAGLTSQTHSLENLSPDTRYRVQVRGKNALGFSPWSGETSFHTPPLPPQEAPKELRVEGLTDVAGRIVWKPLPNVNAYILEMGTDTYASNRGEQTVSAPGVDLKGLVPETNYFFRLRAVNNAGEGPRSEITGFSTQPSPPVNAPEGITVMDVTSHGLTVVWTPTPDAINYEVGFGTDPAVQNAQIRSVATFSCNLTGLNPKTAYTVRVRKVNRGGNGPWSQSRTVTTAPL